MQTFFDRFQPFEQRTQSSASSSPGVSLITPRLGQSYIDQSHQFQATEDIKHYRLWNYIAVKANAEKASESTPNVARIKKVSKPLATRQKYLRQFYPGLIKQDLDDADPVDDSHPLVELLARINSEDWWASFVQETLIYYQLCGRFYWWLIPNVLGLPAEMWVVPPQWIEAVRSQSGEIQKWVISPNGDKLAAFDVPAEEIVYAFEKNPASKTESYSATRAGHEWLHSGEMVELARASTYSQGTMQNIALTFTDAAMGNADLGEAMLDRIETKFAMRHGGVRKMHRPIALPRGVGITPIGLKPNEMILPEVAEQIRDFVLSLHRVPKAVVGISNDLNQASIHGANLIWCEHKIIPLLRFLAGFLTEKVAKRFDPSLVIWFDDVRPHDAENEREEVKLDWEMGAITPNERRLSRNYEAIESEAADTTFVAMNRVPLSTAGDVSEEHEEEPEPKDTSKDSDPPEDEPEDKGTDEKTKQSIRQALEVLSQRQMANTKRRSAILTRFLTLHRRIEKRSLKPLEKFFDSVFESVVQEFDKAVEEGRTLSVETAIDEGKFRDQFNAVMAENWKRGFVTGVEFEQSIHGLSYSQGATRDWLNQAVASFLDSRFMSVFKGVVGTTRAQIVDAISKPIEDGDHIKTMRERLMGLLKTSKQRATRIARTEATASLNYGQQELRIVEDIPLKEWISTIDDKTRESHLSGDGQVVKNDQPFQIGDSFMMHPGDSSLGAGGEEVVACRCTSAGRFDP